MYTFVCDKWCQGGQIVATGTANNLAGGAAAAKKAAAKGGKGQPGKFGKKGDP